MNFRSKVAESAAIALHKMRGDISESLYYSYVQELVRQYPSDKTPIFQTCGVFQNPNKRPLRKVTEVRPNIKQGGTPTTRPCATCPGGQNAASPRVDLEKAISDVPKAKTKQDIEMEKKLDELLNTEMYPDKETNEDIDLSEPSKKTRKKKVKDELTDEEIQKQIEDLDL